MAFPTSPTDGQIYKNKMWNSASNAWVDSSAIVESGSNANGSYVKFSDGTMEQWGGGNNDELNYTSSGGQMYYSFNIIGFPVAFIDKTYSFHMSAVVDKPGLRSCAGSARFRISTNSGVYAEIWKTDTSATASTSWDWHAVGRWRE